MTRRTDFAVSSLETRILKVSSVSEHTAPVGLLKKVSLESNNILSVVNYMSLFSARLYNRSGLGEEGMCHISGQSPPVVDDDVLVQNGVVQVCSLSDRTVLIDHAVFHYSVLFDMYIPEYDRVPHSSLYLCSGGDDGIRCAGLTGIIRGRTVAGSGDYWPELLAEHFTSDIRIKKSQIALTLLLFHIYLILIVTVFVSPFFSVRRENPCS